MPKCNLSCSKLPLFVVQKAEVKQLGSATAMQEGPEVQTFAIMIKVQKCEFGV